MTDIRPDMIGDVPRCSEECQYYDVERRQCGPDWYDEDGICRHESAMREPGDVCLPAVRELVVLSRLTQEQRNGAHARRELAALEWLALRGYPVGRCPDTGRAMARYDMDTGEPRWFDTWADAARDCGWEEGR